MSSSQSCEGIFNQTSLTTAECCRRLIVLSKIFKRQDEGEQKKKKIDQIMSS